METTESLTDGKSKKRTHDSIEVSRDHSSKKHKFDPIEHWRREGSWPKELFKPDATNVQSLMFIYFANPLRRNHSTRGSSVSSNSNSGTGRETTLYQDPECEQLLQILGITMQDDIVGPDEKDIAYYESLLDMQVELPETTDFSDPFFEQIIRDCRDRTKTHLILDIGQLICPSAERFMRNGAIGMKHLCESVQERWTQSKLVIPARPKPDFSVGFTRWAFSQEQLDKVSPILGDGKTQDSCFLATWYMCFPFFSCEAEKTGVALVFADRRNAHSMGIAVRGVVALYRLAGHVEQVDGKILAFSLSYNDMVVEMYGHYPRIIGTETKVYRHHIATVDMEGSETNRWKAYKFVRNVYEHWAPAHLESIRSILTGMKAIEDVSKAGTSKSEATGISQELDRAEGEIDWVG